MKIGIALSTLAALVVIGVGLALAGGGGDSGGTPSASGGGDAVQTTDVTIEDFDFKPPAIEVTAGAKVSFTNEDSAVHTATSEEQGLFDSDDVEEGQTQTVTFGEAGTFAYFCVYHPTMKGEVVVK